MYKLALLGVENSHAKSFLQLIQKGLYPEITVIGVYSCEPEASAKLHDEFGVEVMENYDSLVGQVDGIMVTARHGDLHYTYAKPYLASGIPMFIDKPITCKEEEAIAFMQDAQKYGVRLCGGSTCANLPETLELAKAVADGVCDELRGGAVVAPNYPTSPYGGFYFYGQHLIDIATRIFGEGILRVQAEQQAGSLNVTLAYEKYSVQGAYIASGSNFYAAVYGKKGVCHKDLIFGSDSFRSEMDDMLALLQGEEMKKSYESFILPVFVLNAIERSLATGNWEEIPAIRV
jgi:predicted dehydrogenase